MDKQFKINLVRALTEFKYSKLTEIEIAKRNHISKVTLSKYIHIKNITREHSLYKSPKKPAKKLSEKSKHQQKLKVLHNHAIEYIREAPREDVDEFLSYAKHLTISRRKFLEKMKNRL